MRGAYSCDYSLESMPSTGVRFSINFHAIFALRSNLIVQFHGMQAIFVVVALFRFVFD